MVNKLLQNTISNSKAQAERQPSPAPVDMICLNDVVQLMVNWLWYPYLPLGKLTAILGNPGEGKTYTVMNIIAACTNGRLLPGMKEPMEPMSGDLSDCGGRPGRHGQAAPDRGWR